MQFRKNATHTARLCGFSLKGTGLYYAELDDRAIHGDYVGIAPILASRGESYENCRVGISLGKDFLYLNSKVAVDTDILEFKVHFPPSWIFHLEGWGVDHCLAVRQHKNSTLAQFLFDFSGMIKGVDATMLLGEGMFSVLGVFFRKSSGRDREMELIKMHDDCFEAKVESTPSSYLQEIDIAEATRKMEEGYTEEKIAVLKAAEHNLWTGSEAEIKERLALVERGLHEHSSRVQQQALDTFVIGGRVTDGVDMVVSFLDDPLALTDTVLEKATDAVLCLLCDAYEFNKQVWSVAEAFGTTDVRAIHAQTGGVVTPTQYEALEKIVTARPQARWTKEHYDALRYELQRIVSRVVHISHRTLSPWQNEA